LVAVGDKYLATIPITIYLVFNMIFILLTSLFAGYEESKEYIYYHPSLEEIRFAMEYHGIEKIIIDKSDTEFTFERDGKICFLINDEVRENFRRKK